MPYTPYYAAWHDDPTHDTPIVAAALENIEDGVANAHTAIDAHIADTVDAHDASAISVLDSAAVFTGTEVETVLKELYDHTTATGIPGTIVDAKGDLVGASGPDTPVKVSAATADGLVLTSDSAQATGMKWAAGASNLLSTITDDFNRANGAIGFPPWVPMADGNLTISGNEAVGAGGAYRGSIHSKCMYPEDQYSQITVSGNALPSGAWIGPVVRSQADPGPTLGTRCYVAIYFNNAGSYQIQLYRRDSASTFVQLGATYALSAALPAGTLFRVTATSATLTVSIGSTTAITATDANYYAGYVGIMSYGAAYANAWETQAVIALQHGYHHFNQHDDLLNIAGLAGIPTELQNHLDDTTSAHAATSIGVTDSGGYFAGSNVEAVLQELGASGGSPAGSLIAFAGSAAPAGWLMCNGATASTATYPTLFGVIGYTYGGSSGTFNLPDLRGRVPVGKGTNAAVNTLGATEGVTAESNRRPQHRHTPHAHSVNAFNETGFNTYLSRGASTAGAYNTTSVDGGSGNANDSLDAPAFLVLNYIIKT